MAYCQVCGTLAEERIPDGDSRNRIVCPRCHHIHYENPKIICGALLTHDNRVLLCRRAIEPRYGLWTLPAGFMELNETMEEGALRESHEEADAVGQLAGLYCSYDLPDIGQIYMLFRGELQQQPDGRWFGTGSESLECALFDEADIPWEELAFMSVRLTLHHYFEDRKTGQFPIRMQTIRRQPYAG